MSEAFLKPFWDATAQSRLVLQQCDNCRKFRWTPQPLCPACHHGGYRWSPVSGRGKIYSYSTVHRAPSAAFSPPYVVAVVTLEEGPEMLTTIIDSDPQSLRVGAPVSVRFKVLGDRTVYPFVVEPDGQDRA